MKKTFVVLGNYRGGTSVFTGLLKQLGIFIGENMDNDSRAEKYSNHEDLDFQKKPLDEIKNKIKERDNEHDIWGFKDPMAIQRIEKFYDDLRNPHLICVFRDPQAITESMKRHHSPYTKESIFNLSFEMNKKMTTLVLDPEVILGDKPPILPVSFETAIRYKERSIKRLACFIGVSLDEELLQKCTNLIQK